MIEKINNLLKREGLEKEYIIVKKGIDPEELERIDNFTVNVLLFDKHDTLPSIGYFDFNKDKWIDNGQNNSFDSEEIIYYIDYGSES